MTEEPLIVTLHLHGGSTIQVEMDDATHEQLVRQVRDRISEQPVELSLPQRYGGPSVTTITLRDLGDVIAVVARG